jgi:PhnB protein
MANVLLDVYLFFNGNCREAMEFYKEVFGGDLAVTTYGETPGTESGHEDSLMHARLEGGEVKLMASDVFKKELGKGQIELSLGGEDETRLREIFQKLSDGGTVRSELKTEFWGDTFGSLTDKFGVDWMMNITKPADK